MLLRGEGGVVCHEVRGEGGVVCGEGGIVCSDLMV